MLKATRVLLLAACAALLAPRPASACENVVWRRDPAVESVRRAEARLADASFHAAAREVLARFPRAADATHKDRRPALFLRAQRVLALAVVRSGGAVALGDKLSGRTDAQRAAKLAWAAAILRLHAARRGDVQVRAELAEALARRPLERPESLTLLRDLAAADILPTARAWALLATLEREAGDPDAAARATRRCREIAPGAATCDPDAPAS